MNTNQTRSAPSPQSAYGSAGSPRQTKQVRDASPQGGGEQAPSPARRHLASAGLALLGFLLVGLVWEAIARLSGLDSNILPGAFQVLATMIQLATDPVYLSAIWQTVSAAAVGLLAAMAVGVPLGFAMGLSSATFRVANIIVETLRPIPSVAIIPAALLIFGVGLSMKVFLVFISIVWTILLNTIYAVRDVEPILKDTSRVYGFSRGQIWGHVILPSAAPFIFAGLRIGAIGALLVTIAAELLGGGAGGLGQWLMLTQSAATQNHLVYAGALLSGVVGVAINVGLDRAERRLFSWHASVRGDLS